MVVKTLGRVDGGIAPSVYSTQRPCPKELPVSGIQICPHFPASFMGYQGREGAQIFLTTYNTGNIMTNDLLHPDCYFLIDKLS